MGNTLLLFCLSVSGLWILFTGAWFVFFSWHFADFLCSAQAFLSAQERRNEEMAVRERQRRLEDILRAKREQEAANQFESDRTMDQTMDDIFGFLPTMVGGQEGKAPSTFEVRDVWVCAQVWSQESYILFIWKLIVNRTGYNIAIW